MNGAAETPLPPHQRPPVDGFRLGESAGNVGKSQHQSAHCRVQGPGCGICHEADADRDQPPPPPPRGAGSFLPSRTGLGHNRKHTRHDTVRVCSAPRPPTHTARVCAAVARHLRARACRPSVCGLPRHGARLRLRAATARCLDRREAAAARRHRSSCLHTRRRNGGSQGRLCTLQMEGMKETQDIFLIKRKTLGPSSSRLIIGVHNSTAVAE